MIPQLIKTPYYGNLKRVNEPRHPYYGIYEIFGLQRKAYKTTLMTGLVIDKYMDYSIWTLEPKGNSGYWYKPEDIVINYPIFIEGIKSLDNEHWIFEVTRIKRQGIRHKLIVGDELNSILLSRNTRDMTQAEFAVYVWQMPKMDCNLLWTNNQLTGVDLIIRDGTWNTLMPIGYPDENLIRFAHIHNYGNPNIPPERRVYNDVKRTQELFDSYAQAK